MELTSATFDNFDKEAFRVKLLFRSLEGPPIDLRCDAHPLE
jgi:hypothetical protein